MKKDSKTPELPAKEPTVTALAANHQLPTANYKERVESAYAEVGRRGGEFLRAVCAFGALLDEVAAFLGETRGGDRKSDKISSAAAELIDKTLQTWLAENCPAVNYKTAMGYKCLARMAAKMIGGGTQALAALQGRDTVSAPGSGEVIDVDARVIERRDALFAEVDSRRKLEQAYFEFMAAEGERPKKKAKRKAVVVSEGEGLSMSDSATLLWADAMRPFEEHRAAFHSAARDLKPAVARKFLAELKMLVEELEERVEEK